MVPRNITEACNAGERFGQGLGTRRPARQLFDLCHRKGILVLRTPMDSQLSGAFVRSRRRRMSVVLVNTSGKSAHHQRFTLAHELGHLVLHPDQTGLVESVEDASEGGAAREKEARAFAAALLVPLGELKKVLKESGLTGGDVSDRSVIQLANTFGVSHHVILRRLRIVKDWTFPDVQRRRLDADWNALWKQFAPDGHRDTIPTDGLVTWRADGVGEDTAAQVSRFPQAYREMAFEAYQRGQITDGRLAEVLGFPDAWAVRNELRPLLRPDLAEQDRQTVEALRGARRPTKDE